MNAPEEQSSNDASPEKSDMNVGSKQNDSSEEESDDGMKSESDDGTKEGENASIHYFLHSFSCLHSNYDLGKVLQELSRKSS